LLLEVAQEARQWVVVVAQVACLQAMLALHLVLLTL
jgi:hypothetical protein